LLLPDSSTYHIQAAGVLPEPGSPPQKLGKVRAAPAFCKSLNILRISLRVHPYAGVF
jgi:hypothetical protein